VTHQIPVHAAHPHGRYLSAKTRTFVDVLAVRCSHAPRIKSNGVKSAAKNADKSADKAAVDGMQAPPAAVQAYQGGFESALISCRSKVLPIQGLAIQDLADPRSCDSRRTINWTRMIGGRALDKSAYAPK